MKKSFQVESSEEISSENVNLYNDSESESENAEPTLQSSQSSMEPEDEDLPSDDGDAPVGVSWKDSKAVFQQDERNKNDAMNFARAVDKAQRRKKNEMFVFQKQAKRKYELKKLPEEIVQAVAKKPKQLEVDKIGKDKNEKLEKVKRLKKRKKKQKDREAERNCHVVILEEELNKPKKVQESAAEFLKNHFYGDRLQRTSGSMQLTIQCKSSGIMKPAVKFNTKV